MRSAVQGGLKRQGIVRGFALRSRNPRAFGLLYVRLDGDMGLIMPDRPLDTRESRADNSALIGVVLAAVLAILLILGSRMFNAGEKSVDVNTTQPNIEQPATGETKKQ